MVPKEFLHMSSKEYIVLKEKFYSKQELVETFKPQKSGQTK